MKKHLIILRGVPGCGKSTYIKHFIQRYRQWFGGEPEGYGVGFNFIICSADNYFIRPDNVYDWNLKLLLNAHQWCYKQVQEAIYNNEKVIFIDNTNIKRADYQKYIDLGIKNNYKVKVITIGKLDKEVLKLYSFRNIHNVPLETIEKMARKFEV